MEQTKIFEGLNPPQVEAVEYLEGPLLVLAGAGSGKTKVLTCRIANLLAHDVKPWNILAITFTNKAANEMKSRAEKMIGAPARNAWISTFHSLCARLLRREIDITGVLTRNFTIYDTADTHTVLAECIKKLGLDIERFNGVASRISNAKNNLQNAAKFRECVLKKENTSDYDIGVANIYETYEKKLIENNALDFDDLIFYMVKIFREHPEILDKYQEQFRYILIDEYQDTNTAQYELTRLLAAKYKNLCVVGDADQSIYGFRGANMQNILDFEQDYPDAKTIKLEQNYRSTKQILNAANAVIEHNRNRKEKILWTENETGNKINFIHCLSDRSEAAFIAREIRRLITYENVHYNDIAILYRTNAQSRAFEEKFLTADIPYVIVGGTKFYERKEIKDIVAYLRLIVNPRDDISFLRVVNVPRRGIGPINLERLTDFAAQRDLAIFDVVVAGNMLDQVPQLSPKCKQKLREFAIMVMYFSQSHTGTPVPAIVKAVLHESGYWASLTEGEDAEKPENVSRAENISSFVNGAEEFAESNPDASLEDFLSHIALVADIDSLDENKSLVSLMTIHAAKGLEFPIVFLAGAEEGLLPHSISTTTFAELEEERRACYVAMTRAKKSLYITAAGERKAFGRAYESQISRFVSEIPSECMASFSERNSNSSNFRQSMDANRAAAAAAQMQTATAAPSEPKAPPAPPKREPKIPIPSAKPVKTLVEWQVGDKLSHRKWGVGTVMAVNGENITISFANPEYGTKSIKASVAPVEKV